jgi:hypothetical protein
MGLADVGPHESRVGVVADEGLLTTGATAPGRGLLGQGLGLAGQTEVEHLFRQDFTDFQQEGFDVGQGGAPGRSAGPVELIDEVFGNAFDVGAHFFYPVSPLFGRWHVRILSGLAAKGQSNFLCLS